MFDPGLLEETRNKWIIVTYNASDGYNLEKPDVMDPSMGQAEAINELYGNMASWIDLVIWIFTVISTFFLFYTLIFCFRQMDFL